MSNKNTQSQGDNFDLQEEDYSAIVASLKNDAEVPPKANGTPKKGKKTNKV